jgi:HlyD family secretion protein
MATTSLWGKSNRPLLWIFGLMAAGLLGVGTLSYRLAQSPATETELEKLTVPVTRETISLEIKASGTVEPIQSVNISPKTPGQLVQLRVDQGMRVKKGDILAIMDYREVATQGNQAVARHAEAQANLEMARRRIPEEIRQLQTRLVQAQGRVKEIESRLNLSRERIPKDFDQAREQLRAAGARRQLAQARLQRNQSLVQEGAISQDQFDEVLNEYLNAEANLREVQYRLEQIDKTASPEMQGIQQELLQAQAGVMEAKFALEERLKTKDAEIGQLQAAAAVADQEIKRFKIQFDDMVIRAPFDGIITQKFATAGAFVTPTTSASSTASATSSSIIALARGLEVVAKVPEVDISHLKIGQPVNIVADAYPDTVFQGQVVGIAPEAIVEGNVTSFEVRVGLRTGLDKLLSKMNVDVVFLGQPVEDALVVPTVSVVTEKGQTGVMVPNQENQPEFKPISIGLVLDEKTQVLSGLESGEKVFIDLPKNTQEKEEK